MHSLQDQVFEEYEIFYEVDATCLTNLNKKISWKLTPTEAFLVTNTKDESKLGSLLLKNILVSENKFIYIISNKDRYMKL